MNLKSIPITLSLFGSFCATSLAQASGWTIQETTQTAIANMLGSATLGQDSPLDFSADAPAMPTPFIDIHHVLGNYDGNYALGFGGSWSDGSGANSSEIHASVHIEGQTQSGTVSITGKSKRIREFLYTYNGQGGNLAWARLVGFASVPSSRFEWRHPVGTINSQLNGHAELKGLKDHATADVDANFNLDGSVITLPVPIKIGKKDFGTIGLEITLPATASTNPVQQAGTTGSEYIPVADQNKYKIRYFQTVGDYEPADSTDQVMAFSVYQEVDVTCSLDMDTAFFGLTYAAGRNKMKASSKFTVTLGDSTGFPTEEPPPGDGEGGGETGGGETGDQTDGEEHGGNG